MTQADGPADNLGHADCGLQCDTCMHFKRELVSPPEGWFVFGHHVDIPGELEFWGESEDGMPIWERPAQTGAAGAESSKTITTVEWEDFLNSPVHAPADTHSRYNGECSECPWPVYQLPPAEMAIEIAKYLAGRNS